MTAERIAGLPEIVELNIGYYMIGEALFTGLGETVRAMRAAMDRGRKMAAGQPPDSENPTGKT
jgi:pyridoxine 5-phosphate synthase